MKTTWKNWTCLVGTALCLLAPAVMRGQDTEPVNVEPVALRAVEQTNSEAAYDQAFNRPEGDHKRLGAVVAIGKGAELKAGESAEAVVAVGGSAKSAGHVSDSVVAVFGD
ncbi:MAG TPA: hypothetical protein VK327_04740, partial [Candidatus Paceibacterota bacterium]|nr:hypothetical protein [Candidatus Paceibacterota bacterium]